MNDYESIKFLLMSLIEATYNNRKPFFVSSEEIRREVFATSKTLPLLKNLTREALDIYCKDLETMYDISQEFGYSVKASNHKPWFDDRKPKIDFHYWNRFNKYLKREGQIPSQIISILDNVSDEIVDYLGDPTLEGSWKRKGMVVGQVQSGKTTNYSSVICKAADVGYKIIILLAGVTNDLRRQTQQRLNHAFIGKNATSLREMETGIIGAANFADPPRKHPQNGTTLRSDFSLKQAEGFLGSNIQSNTEPTIFICKKNTSTLKNLKKFFEVMAPNILPYSLLLIDDEADNASINTSGDKTRVTRINEGIRDLLVKFEKSSYIGYTATPFANIFIDPDTEEEMEKQDLFPSDYIKVLEPPSNYIGPEKIFLDEDISERAVRIVDDYAVFSSEKDEMDLKHKNLAPIDDLPESLFEAIRIFILSKVIRTLRGEEKQHATMMINVSRFNSVQDDVHGLVYDYINELSHHVELNANVSYLSKKSDILEMFKDDYQNEFLDIKDKKYTYPDWKQIRSNLTKVIRSIKVQVVNMKRGSLDYEQFKDEGLTVIAIGGLALSRGLTLEGLMVSYILRNASAYDTLMQMGRWFGYRKNYDDLCRLYLPSQSNSYYQDVTEAMLDLSDQIKTMEQLNKTPLDFGLRVRENRGAIRITAANKMKTAEKILVSVGYAGKHIQSHNLYTDNQINDSNRFAIKSFFKKIGLRVENVKVQRTDFFWQDVNVNDITDLLNKLNFPTDDFVKRGSGSYIIDYINKCRDKLQLWDVVLDNDFLRDNKNEFDKDLIDEIITPRKRHKGQFENNNKIYKVTQSRKITSANISYGLPEDVLGKDENGKSIKGSELEYNQKRTKPLLLIMCIDAKPSVKSEKDFEAENVHKNFSVGITINFPGNLSKEDVKLEYQANVVYQHQRDLFEDFLDEESDEEAEDILNVQVV